MKLKTIIEYDIDDDGVISDYCIIQEPNENIYSNMDILTAIITAANVREQMFTFSKYKVDNLTFDIFADAYDQFYESKKKNINRYVNQLLRMHWRDVESFQKLNIEN